MRACRVVAVCLALTVAACGSAASHSTSRRAPGVQPGPARQPPGGPARNSFQGTVVSAGGAYAGERGRAEVSLQVRRSGVSRPITVVFRSLRCQGAPQCVQLDGTLTGRIVAQPGVVPDVGQNFAITASGRLTTLGRVSAAGVAHGTGFIGRGRELLDLKLTSRSGRITLEALSKTVRGFTSP